MLLCKQKFLERICRVQNGEKPGNANQQGLSTKAFVSPLVCKRFHSFNL